MKTHQPSISYTLEARNYARSRQSADVIEVRWLPATVKRPDRIKLAYAGRKVTVTLKHLPEIGTPAQQAVAALHSHSVSVDYIVTPPENSATLESTSALLIINAHYRPHLLWFFGITGFTPECVFSEEE
jgi:hypothetical protein